MKKIIINENKEQILYEEAVIEEMFGGWGDKVKAVKDYLDKNFSRASSTIIGAVSGYFLGLKLVPIVFYKSYQAVYDMNGIPNEYSSPMGIIMGIVMIVVSIVITLVSILIALRETPASQMLAKAPKPGKKILLEKISFIWKRIIDTNIIINILSNLILSSYINYF